MVLVFIMSNRYDTSMLFMGISHLWFLLMLFGIFLITHFVINRVNLLKDHLLIVVFVLSAIYILDDRYIHYGNLLCYKQMLRYFPMFLLGGYLVQHNSHFRNLKIGLAYLTSIIVLVFIQNSIVSHTIITVSLYYLSIILVLYINSFYKMSPCLNTLKENSRGGI